MLPLLPSSAYIRNPKFVTQEWNEYFAPNGVRPATQVEAGWKGVLYANLALIQPKAAWDFFTGNRFDYSSIDGGASRTWYLAFAAGGFSALELLVAHADMKQDLAVGPKD